MFDAEAYFDAVSKALSTCESYAEIKNPQLTVRRCWQDWEVIVWRAEIHFSSGEIADCLEAHERKMRVRKHFRKLKYHFMSEQKECIFRLDTHRSSIPFDEPCHLHVGASEMEIQDGDPRLCGTSLVEINFLDAFKWIHAYLEGKPFPWVIE